MGQSEWLSKYFTIAKATAAATPQTTAVVQSIAAIAVAVACAKNDCSDLLK